MKKAGLLFAMACLCLEALSLAQVQAKPVFPIPKEIEPNIKFWKRVYSEWTTDQIAFTDEEDLRLVYTVVDVPPDTHPFFRKLRAEKIKATKKELMTALNQLDALRPQSESEVSGLARQVFLNLKGVDRDDKYRRIDFIRAQNGLKNRFEEGYYLSGAHEKEMRLRFKEAGLPEELIAIVFVESLFYPSARSHAGAAGLWQFLKGTAKEYMRVNNLVDERFDPVVATEAAIRYVKAARETLGEWPLVITSYNYGRAGMLRAVNTVGSTDFNEILQKYDHDRFGFASRNYYAEFLAALEVYEEAKLFFPQIHPLAPWDYDVFTLSEPVFARDLAAHDGSLAQSLTQLNPALTKAAREGNEVLPSGFALRIPRSKTEVVLKTIRLSNASERRKAEMKERARHRANGRQTLAEIARLYDVFHDQLAERLGFGPMAKPKKGTIVTVRSAESRYTQIPEPLYRPGKIIASDNAAPLSVQSP